MIIGGTACLMAQVGNSYLRFGKPVSKNAESDKSVLEYTQTYSINVTNGVVTRVSNSVSSSSSYLETNVNYSTPYTPLYA